MIYMPSRILYPITREGADEAIKLAPLVARVARERNAVVIVLQTDCLHGMFTEVDGDYSHIEMCRMRAEADRVAAAIREHGVPVEAIWECVQVPRRPVDLETVRQLGADAVIVPHRDGLAGLFETLRIRHLRRHHIEVICPRESQMIHSGELSLRM